MTDTLPEIIDQTDLPELVSRCYPDSGAKPGCKGVVFAVWRSEQNESFSMFKNDKGRWLYRDHCTGETGNAFGFLTKIYKLSKAEAAKLLKDQGELKAAPEVRGKMPITSGDAVYRALQRAVEENRVVRFKHPASQVLLSERSSYDCLRSELATPSRDHQKILAAARVAMKNDAKRRKNERRGEPVAFYDYRDERGELLYQVVRFEPKSFCQRRPYKGVWAWGLTEDFYFRGENGHWRLQGEGEAVKLTACRQILYELREVMRAETVFVVEGEKDVQALSTFGLTATCNSGGAGKWDDAYSEVLRGKEVIILPDNDAAGHAHAERVKQSLSGVAKTVRLVQLPELAPGGDPWNWVKSRSPRWREGQRCGREQILLEAGLTLYRGGSL